MNSKEIHDIAQRIFAAAMIHAAQNGDTVMEDGRDEYFWGSASSDDLLRAAASFFEETC